MPRVGTRRHREAALRGLPLLRADDTTSTTPPVGPFPVPAAAAALLRTSHSRPTALPLPLASGFRANANPMRPGTMLIPTFDREISLPLHPRTLHPPSPPALIDSSNIFPDPQALWELERTADRYCSTLFTLPYCYHYCYCCHQFALLLSSSPRRPHELLHVSAARAAGVQVLRRFTGGGTVVVDSDTLFTTLIMQVGQEQGRPSPGW